MTDLDAEEPLSSLSDSSFVILGQGSVPLIANVDTCEEPNLICATNNKSSFSGSESTNGSVKSSQRLSGSSFSEEIIQKKLNELVKENYQLKETLSQNNLAIKSQLDTFFMWQQEVLKTHETHKQKFLETKELILKLRAENASLKKQLEDSLIGIPSGNRAGIYAKVIRKPEEQEKTKDGLVVFEKIDSSSENENLSMKILRLNEELKAAKNEILKLHTEVEDLGRDNTYLKQRNDDLNKNSLESTSHRSLPNSEARTQISNLLKQLDEEKSKVIKLKEELKKKANFSNEKAPDSKLSTTEELKQYIDKLNDMDTSLDMQNQRFSGLQSWVSLTEESLKENKINAGVECNLICEINELKSHLNQEENVSREKQEMLQELKKKFTTLLDDYKVLQLKLSTLSSNDVSIEKYKEEISNLSAKLEAKNSELKLKEEECCNLKEETAKQNLMSEEINLLKVQVEVYQSDFLDERAAREKLVGEKEDLAEEIRHLQSRIKNLEQENPKRKGDSEASPSESQGLLEKCSRCSFSYSDWDSCIKHFDECLNIHFYP